MSFTCSLFMCSVNFTVLVCVCNSLTSSMAVYILDLHFSYMNISSLRSYDKKKCNCMLIIPSYGSKASVAVIASSQ